MRKLYTNPTNLKTYLTRKSLLLEHSSASAFRVQLWPRFRDRSANPECRVKASTKPQALLLTCGFQGLFSLTKTCFETSLLSAGTYFLAHKQHGKKFACDFLLYFCSFSSERNHWIFVHWHIKTATIEKL